MPINEKALIIAAKKTKDITYCNLGMDETRAIIEAYLQALPVVRHCKEYLAATNEINLELLETVRQASRAAFAEELVKELEFLEKHMLHPDNKDKYKTCISIIRKRGESV